MNKSDLITTRGFLPDDRNFILATFLRGLYYGDSWFSLIDKNVFMNHYNKIVTQILDSPLNTVSVACLKDDPNTVLGYAIYSQVKSTLHWCFVKKQWRGIGIAKDLVPKDIFAVTHLTKVGVSVIKKKGWSFNPFLL
jgi:hypothetical protein